MKNADSWRASALNIGIGPSSETKNAKRNLTTDHTDGTDKKRAMARSKGWMDCIALIRAIRVIRG